MSSFVPPSVGRVFRTSMALLGLLGSATLGAEPPQFVHEYAFAGQWGSQGTGDGQFVQPFGIALDVVGQVYVADGWNGRIQKFDAAGQYLSQFGSLGTGNGQFMDCFGVATDGISAIYVLDFNGNRVQKFNSVGIFQSAWGTGGTADGEFSTPRCLAVGPSGNVYVSDYGNNRIQVFDSNGGFIRKWGVSGSGDGEFSQPDGIAVDGGENVYVVDPGNSRVQVFTSTGTFLRKWGSAGSGDGQFDGPIELDLGPGGILFVADTNNDRVQAFTTDGVFLGKWGTTGTGGGQFTGPSGLGVTSDGRVYVSDFEGNNGHRIQYFDPPWNVTMDEGGSPRAFSLTLAAFDAEADTITWSIASDGAHGTASVSGTGTSKAIGYTPEPDFFGADSFTVQIDDGNGGLTTKAVRVTISPVNEAPVIDQGAGPLSVTMSEDGAPTAFVAPTLSATDADGDSIVWSVSSAASHGTATVDGFGETPMSFTYIPATGYSGTDSFTVEASDGELGDTIAIEVTIEAASEAPVIAQGAGPITVTMDEDGTFAAPTLGATDADTATGSLVWSVSSPASSGSAVASGSGASPATFTYQPATSFNGEDSFTVQVSDGTLTDTIAVNVTVLPVDDAPAIDQGAGPLSASMSEDGIPTAFVAPTVHATDVEGDVLTWSVLSQASHGTASASGSGASPAVFTYVPAANFNGSDSFTIQVSDGALTDTVAVNVSVAAVNDGPAIDQGAGPLSVTMDEDGAFNAPALSATDPDTADPVWSIATGGNHGTATASGTGTSPAVFTYVPETNFNGSDSFQIEVSDGEFTDSIAVSVTIAAVDDPPAVSSSGISVTMDEDGPSPDFSALLIAAEDPDTDTALLTWQISAQGTKGRAAVGGTGATPVIAYVSQENANGLDTFTLSVSDDAGNEAPIALEVNITPQPDPPTITQGDSVTAIYNLHGTAEGLRAPEIGATDVDGDVLAWSMLTPPEHGTAAVEGTGPSPASIAYTPAEGYLGTDVFSIQVDDGNGGTDSVTVTVTISDFNDFPIISEGAGPIAVAMDEDGAFAAPVVTATDTNGDALTWSITTPAQHGTATASGDGASPQVLTYAPAANYHGTDNFTLQVSDQFGGVDTLPVTVTIASVEDAPQIAQGAGPVQVTMDEDGTPLDFVAPVLSAADADTDVATLIWSISSPAGHGIAVAQGTGASPALLTYTPTGNFHGTDSFTVMVQSGGLSDTISVQVTVGALNDAPSFEVGDRYAWGGGWEIPLPQGASALERLPIAVAGDGNVYVADNSAVRIYSVDGAFVRDFASVGADSVAVDGSGRVYVSRSNPVRIERYLSTGLIDSSWPSATDLFPSSVLLDPIFLPFSIDVNHSISGVAANASGDAHLIRRRVVAGSSYDLGARLLDLDASGALTRESDVPSAYASGAFPLVGAVSNSRYALAVDSGNRVYLRAQDYQIGFGNVGLQVVNRDVIQIRNTDGSVLRSWEVPSPRGAGDTRSIAVRPDGEVIVLGDTGRTDVLVYEPGGGLMGRIGVAGTAPGTFSSISGLAANGSGRVYVSDAVNRRVEYFDVEHNEEEITVFMDEDGSPTPFQFPAVAVDADGDTLAWAITSAAVHGTATGVGGISYLPAANYHGTDRFSIQIDDGNGGADTLTVNVVVESVEDAPAIIQGAGPIFVAMDEDGVFAAPALTATDAEGDALTWSLESNPGRGTAVASGVGGAPEVLTYAPNADYNGQDSFTVRVTDAKGGADSIAVVVTIATGPDAPRIVEGDTYAPVSSWEIPGADTSSRFQIAAGGNGELYVWDSVSLKVHGADGRFLRTFPEIEADSIAADPAGRLYTLRTGTNSLNRYFSSGAVDPTVGYAGGASGFESPVGLAVGLSGRIYTTEYNRIGYRAPHVTAYEGSGGTVWRTEVRPEQSNILSTATRAVAVDAAENVYVLVDEYEIGVPTSRNKHRIYLYNASGAFQRSWGVSGDWIAGGAGNALYLGDSAAKRADFFAVSGVLLDQFGQSGSPIQFGAVSGIASDLAGRAFVADGPNKRIHVFKRAVVGETVNVTMDVNGTPETFGLTLNGLDPDGDPVTWSVASGAGHGTASVSGTGDKKSIVYAPEADYAGDDSFEIAISDDTGRTDSVAVNVAIGGGNSAPAIAQGAGPITVALDVNGTPTAFRSPALSAVDADGDLMVWSLATPPGHGTATVSGTGESPSVLRYVPAASFTGNDTFTVQVSDGHGGLDSMEIKVIVRAVQTGGLTPEELASRARSNFDLTDVNQDGAISREEAELAFPEASVDTFDELDSDSDGFLTEEELAAVDIPATGCNNPGSAKNYFTLDVGEILRDLWGLFAPGF